MFNGSAVDRFGHLVIRTVVVVPTFTLRTTVVSRRPAAGQATSMSTALLRGTPIVSGITFWAL